MDHTPLSGQTRNIVVYEQDWGNKTWKLALIFVLFPAIWMPLGRVKGNIIDRTQRLMKEKDGSYNFWYKR